MSSGYDAVDGGAADDCNGHGTHVAGTVGGAAYGVAKGVQLVAVRVLDCQGSGTTAGVIAGVDWVRPTPSSRPWPTCRSAAAPARTLDAAVANSINRGVTYALAAGTATPAGRGRLHQLARAGGGGDHGGQHHQQRQRVVVQNYGTCVDILAPGSSITSAWYQSDTETSTISGTRMATPHVAGAAALYLQGNSSATPAQVATALVSNSNPNRITLQAAASRAARPTACCTRRS